jgi:hypothetical protein
VRILITALTAFLAIPAFAQPQPSCGEPPRVDDQSLKGDLEGKAKFLSSLLGDANLKGQVEAVRTDIFRNYPEASKTRSDAYLQYMFCSFVLSDPKLPTERKFQVIQEFRQAQISPGVSTSGSQSPGVISGGDANINYGAAPATQPGGASTPTAPVGPVPSGTVRTEGNQSPGVISRGNTGIQYAPNPPAAPAK